VTELWLRYAAKFDALTMRERVFVFAAVLVALLALIYTVMLEPEIKRQRANSLAMVQKQSEIRAFEAQVTRMVATRAQDPDKAARERLASLKRELGELDARIAAEERKFTEPSQMRAVVEGLLGRNRGVSLVEMKTLAVTTIAPPAKPGAKPAAKPERLIYRHGLELTVSGPYLDLLAYMRDLERLPTQLYWGSLELDAVAYPAVSMKVTVYTLSLDRAWLSV
jgi:MSHA biogenesis protein MshJ